jgi:ketosteroid isomerase-like protein
MSHENVEIVRRLWADLETENSEASIHLLDEAVEIWNAPEFPITGPYRGRDGVRQWAAEQWEVFSGLHHEIEEIIEAPDGETLVSVQRNAGTHEAHRHEDQRSVGDHMDDPRYQGPSRLRIPDQGRSPRGRRAAGAPPKQIRDLNGATPKGRP